MLIRRLPPAIRDVDEIWSYVVLRNERAADRLVERIARSVERLARFPRSGSPRPDIHPDAYSVLVDPYLVLYRIGEDAVEIVRVVHSARNMAAIGSSFQI